MTIRAAIQKMSDVEWLNVLLTNRIPRRTLTRVVGWLAKVEQPFVRDFSIAVWRLFSDLDLGEAKKTQFKSLHDCFIRELKDGARPLDMRSDILVSPCDAIVGASGVIADGIMLQVKGSSYRLAELLRSEDLVTKYRNGTYVTLRLTAGMYHRFHAPYDGRITRVAHIAGDTWNVNPPTLQRIERVFCRNERAVLRFELARGGYHMALVPVAAILVAGLRLRFMDLPGDRMHPDPWERACDVVVTKGQELGWFEHGSTIIALAPPGFALAPEVVSGEMTRMGRPLLVMPEKRSAS